MGFITFGRPKWDKKLGIFTGIVVGVYNGGDSPEPTPTGDTMTYAIFDTLADATALLPDVYFDWVWDKDAKKWYRLNKEGKYEQYGIYADSIDSATTTYKGKLANVDDKTIEYEYTGSAWKELGENPMTSITYTISGSTYTGATFDDYITMTIRPSGDWYITFDKDVEAIDFTVAMKQRISYSSSVLFYNPDGTLAYTFSNTDTSKYVYFTASFSGINSGDTIHMRYNDNWTDYLIVTLPTIVGHYYKSYPEVDDAPLMRVYNSFSDYTADKGKYGNSIIYTLDDDKYYSLTYDGVLTDLETYNCYLVQASGVTDIYEPKFYSAYDKSESSWYFVNNKGKYEQYGNYGDSIDSATTTYKGKLAVTNGEEYEYDGNNWVDVGAGSAAYYSYSFSGYVSAVTYDTYIRQVIPDGSIDLYITVQQDIASIDFPVHLQTKSGREGCTSTLKLYAPDGTLKYTFVNSNVTGHSWTATFTDLKSGDTIHMNLSEYYNDPVASYINFPTKIIEVPKEYDTLDTPPSLLQFDSNDDFNNYSGCTYEGLVAVVTSTGAISYRNATTWETIDNENAMISYTSSDSSVVEPNVKTEFRAEYIVSFYTDMTKGKVLFDGNVVIIPVNSFSGCTKLTSVALPDTVTTLQDGAFSGCTSLSAISGSNVVALGDCVFRGCSNLSGLSFGSSMTSLPSYGFQYTGIGDILWIPSNVKTIGEKCFANCNKLKYVDLSNFTRFGNSAFAECTSITGATFPTGMTVMPNGLFTDCTSFVGDIVIPDGYVTLDTGCFRNTRITSITLPDTLTTIGGGSNWGALYGCSKLTSITLPSSVKTIKTSGLQNCTGLASINLDNVTTLESSALLNCSKLTDIDISNVTSMGTYVFQDCTSLTGVTFSTSLSGIPNGTFRNSGIQNIDWIPSNVKTLGELAFYQCKSLLTANIPDSITAITSTAEFQECSSLTSVTFGTGLTKLDKLSTFAKCTSLKSIYIPKTITIVTGQTFWEDTSLSSITFEDASTLTSLGQGGYYNWVLNVPLAELRVPGITVSFNIDKAVASAMTEEALVQILNDLGTVSNGQTFTMGSTNLAKLTDDEKAIATDKGWTLN